MYETIKYYKYKAMNKLLLCMGISAPIAFLLNLFTIKAIYAASATIVNNEESIKLDRECCLLKQNRLLAQTEKPNRDRFLQPDLEPLPPINPESEPILPEKEPTLIPESEAEGEDIEIAIAEIKITGGTVFTAQELQQLARPLEGKKVKISELKKVATKITNKYLQQGYITSRAILPQQEVTNGIVEIKIIEGSIANIQIEGNNRLKESYLRDRLELGTNSPVRVDNLEGQLQLLRSNQTIKNIEANLQPAPGEGESSLVVEVDEASPWLYGAEINNYSTVATGAERLGISLGSRNLTGNSDSLIFGFTQALSANSQSYSGSYSIPLNAKDGTLQLRTSINRNEIVGEDFEDLNLEGDSELYEVSFRQPLTRTLQKEFAVSLGFSYQESRDFFNGVALNQTNRTSVIKFGQDYTKRDVKGVWAFRSQFNLGFDGSDENEDVLIAGDDFPDDVFISWLGQTQRLQRINPDNLLIIQADLQLTPNTLSPSEQFVIGGAQSVRGYRQNARLGENGFRLSIEDRITLIKNKAEQPLFQIAPFADLGVVGGDSTEDIDNNFLAGIGLGLISEPIPGLSLRLDYAPPLVDLEETGDNIQEDGFYFRLSYRN